MSTRMRRARVAGRAWPGAGSRCSGRAAAHGGFTLVELTVVMVVLVTLAGMAVTSLSWLGSARQNMAAARVRTTLVFAQEWALGSGNRTWVAFDVPNDLVTVHVEDPDNPGKANRMTMTDPLTRAPMTLQLGADGVGIVSVDMGATDEVEFDWLGVPHDANGIPLPADGTVALTGGGSVRVTRATGLVTVD